MSFLAIALTTSSLATGSESQRLVDLLLRDGRPRMIQINQREDLKIIFENSRSYAQQLDLGCTVGAAFDVLLKRDGFNLIGGYRVNLDCEDAPTSSIALFFDVSNRFIGAFDQGR
jgi:hypothetical protein